MFVHLGLESEDEEKEEEEEGVWLWDPGEEGKAEARKGTVILHLCGQFLGSESLSTDQKASGSYRNVTHPVCPVLIFLEGQHSGRDDTVEGTLGTHSSDLVWPRPVLSIFIRLQTDRSLLGNQMLFYTPTLPLYLAAEKGSSHRPQHENQISLAARSPQLSRSETGGTGTEWDRHGVPRDAQ